MQGSSEPRYRVIDNPAELERVLVPVLLANGSELPNLSTTIAVVEYDEAGEIAAYQLIQQGVFLEGMWSRDGNAHFLALWEMTRKVLVEQLDATGVMTFVRDDTELGDRIGRIAERMKFERLPLTVYRRMF